MSKHTKGPWTTTLIKNDLSMNGVGIVEVNGPKGIICNLEESTIEETLANAQLIAASPEMLEALEECCRLLIGCTVNSVDPKDFAEIRQKCYDIQDYIIAKAKGE